MGLGWMSTVSIKLAFRFMLLRRPYTRSEFEKFISSTEFHQADIQENPMGLEIRLEK